MAPQTGKNLLPRFLCEEPWQRIFKQQGGPERVETFPIGENEARSVREQNAAMHGKALALMPFFFCCKEDCKYHHVQISLDVRTITHLFYHAVPILTLQFMSVK